MILVTDESKAKLVARNYSTCELEFDSISIAHVP